MGAFVDEREGTAAAIVRAQGSSFCLLDDNDKERRLASWAAVLESLSNQRSSLVRLQWCRARPARRRSSLISHLRRTGNPASPGYAGHMALLESAGPRSRRHETLLVVAVHARCRRGRPSPEGAAALRNEVRAFRARCATWAWYARAFSTSAAPPPPSVGSCCRTWYATRPPTPGPWPSKSTGPMCTPTFPGTGPTGWRSGPAGWRRPDFLSPLLVGMGRRSFSVVMAPVAAERAVRDAESSRTAQLADAQLRAQGGFLETAQQRRRAEAVEGRETELADGRGSFQLAGYVSVSGDDKPGLEEACAELERAAGAAKICLRPLFGQQKEALTWALPFGRGL